MQIYYVNYLSSSGEVEREVLTGSIVVVKWIFALTSHSAHEIIASTLIYH